MIVKLLSLKCDFCTAQVTDEFEDEEDARKLMAEHGWTQEKVENGSLWDKCPKCNGTQATSSRVGDFNEFNQKIVQPLANSRKVWMECGDCGHVYVCDSDKTDRKSCPRSDRHDVLHE